MLIVTRQQLVKSDQDDYVDVYDVRVGAAPPDQPLDTAPACDGDACQGAVSATPADDAVGSLAFEDARAAAGHARLTVRRRATVNGAAGLLRVRLSGAGRIAWSGRGLVSGSVRRGSAGTVKLRLRLSKSARVQLERSGHYATVVRLTFPRRRRQPGHAHRPCQVQDAAAEGALT